MKIHLLIFLTCLTLGGPVFAQTNPKGVAEINGQPITQDELDKAAADELKGLETKRLQNAATLAQDRQEIMNKALEELAANKLIEAEAKKQNITPEKLLENEVDGKVKPPTPADADAFYETNKARIPIPKEAAIPQIMDYLVERNRDVAHAALIKRLKKEHAYKSYLEPLRLPLETAGYPTLGPANAPITIVEFSDFECPFCGGLFPTLKQIEKEYEGKLRVVYREFPLTSIHPHAEKAAEAALCAFEQQKFWEFHDSMFGNQKELTVDDLKKRAVDLKLDAAKFNECLDSGRTVDAIQKDIQEGSRSGVNGTPAMFINGRFLNGNQPYQVIKDLIDDELDRKQITK